MVIPTAGTDFSFEKWLQLNVTVAPDTNLTNLKFYTDGTIGFGAGVTAYGKSVTTYATPAAATATGGYTDIASYTSGAALDLGTAAVTGTGQKGDHAVLMLTVDNTAAPGTLTAEVVTFAYDEL
jgi:hypothetical protein